MRLFGATVLIILSITLSACDEFGNAPGSSTSVPATSENLQGTATGTGEFFSVDGSVKIECPQDWIILDLNDDADIEVGTDDKELYVLVMSLPKIDYAGDRAQYSADTRGFLVEGTTNVSQADTGKTEINGNPAVQYKIQTTIDRTNYMYMHTIIETDEKYHQVLTWSYPSQFMKYEDLFNTITDSLVEVAPEQ